MSFLKLNVITPGGLSREVRLEDDYVAIGRALDNTIPLDEDSNVSRYHAEIEKRGPEFWIVDLGSSNGTTVNDAPVEFEHPLTDGDLIGIGGSTIIEFHLRETPWPTSRTTHIAAERKSENRIPQISNSVAPTTSSQVPAAQRLEVAAPAHQAVAPPVPSTGPSPLLIVAGVGGAVVLVALIGVLIYKGMSHECSPSAHIISPETGTTIRQRTPIRIEVEDASCIERVIYKIDGVEVAKAESSPFEIVLDPNQLVGVSGGNHILSLVVEDDDGNLIVSPDTVLIGFDNGVITQNDPVSTPEPKAADQSTPAPVQSGTIDVNSLADRLAAQISGKTGYIFDRDFVQLINMRSNEYRVSGYSANARRYRREINKAFRDQGVDPLLGYLLAMSRSKFNINATGAGIGLWQMPMSLVQSQGYLNPGESEATLRDPKRSAEIAATYTKSLIGLFETPDDFMFAVACFGQPLTEVGLVRAQLATIAPNPVARRNFFQMVRSGVVKGDQVDRVVRFFAAGIVGENPRPFGLTSDEPFSSLS